MNIDLTKKILNLQIELRKLKEKPKPQNDLSKVFDLGKS